MRTERRCRGMDGTSNERRWNCREVKSNDTEQMGDDSVRRETKCHRDATLGSDRKRKSKACLCLEEERNRDERKDSKSSRTEEK